MKAYFKLLFSIVLLAVSLNLSAGPVNINSANYKTLAENIKGVGEKKAKAIVAYREKHGPFRRADDLINIKGIGPKLIEKNRNILLIKQSKTK